MYGMITLMVVMTIWAYASGEAVIGTMALLILFLLLFMLIKEQQNPELVPVDYDEAIQAYVDWMEKKRKISIADPTEHFSDETPTHHRVVLEEMNQSTGRQRYYPFEFHKYYSPEGKILFGFGKGTHTEDIRDVKHFILRNVNPSEKPVQDTIRSIALSSIDEFMNNPQTPRTEGGIKEV